MILYSQKDIILNLAVSEFSSTNYPSFINEEKSKMLAGTLLEYPTSTDSSSLRFGPIFTVEPSGAKGVSLHTAFFDQWEASQGKVSKNYFIFALGQDTRLLGVRRTSIVRERSWFEARGGIITFVRGIGLTIPIELVHIELLANEAKKEGISVSYHVENKNRRKLEQLEDQYKDSPELSELVRQKREEQRRWMAVYGERGLLGFNKWGFLEIKIRSLQPPFDLEGTEKVELQRRDDIDDGGFVAGMISDIQEAKDPPTLRAQRVSFYNEVILPQILAA